jgi:hypothetical protein
MLLLVLNNKAMSQLTKEFFEEQLKGLATKKDLEQLVTKTDLDERLKNLATKDNVQNAVEEGVESVARIINEAFQEHQNNFLQDQFDRLSAQLSLATELKTVKIDIKAILTDLQQMKQRVDKLEQKA